MTDIIKDFVALGFIIEVDNVFSRNLSLPLVQKHIEIINGDGGLIIKYDPQLLQWIWSNMLPSCACKRNGRAADDEQYLNEDTDESDVDSGLNCE